MDALAGFLRDAAALRFAYGRFDCGLFCANWYAQCTGTDPAAEWRGRYHSALGLARVLKQRGGIVAHFDACLIDAIRTTDPQRGDIAIVETPQGLTGGIIVNSTAIALVGDGVIIRNRSLAPLVAAWSL